MTDLRITAALVLPVLWSMPVTGQVGDPDSDGDGLTDFQETHKYGTDPERADSDGDGLPDGAVERTARVRLYDHDHPAGLAARGRRSSVR